MNSRWIKLYATSPSGKTLFVCKYCGRQSPTPDRVCQIPPFAAHAPSMPCAILEETEAVLQMVAEETKLEELHRHAVYQIDLHAPNEATVVWQADDGNMRRKVLNVECPQIKELLGRFEQNRLASNFS